MVGAIAESPISYLGGKKRLAGWITGYFSGHKVYRVRLCDV